MLAMPPVFTLLTLIEALETQPGGRGTDLAAMLRALPTDAGAAKIAEVLCPANPKRERFYHVLRVNGMSDNQIDEVWNSAGVIAALWPLRTHTGLNLTSARELLCSALGVGPPDIVAAFNDRERPPR
jgi:hypothetical protein